MLFSFLLYSILLFILIHVVVLLLFANLPAAPTLNDEKCYLCFSPVVFFAAAGVYFCLHNENVFLVFFVWRCFY